MALANPDKVKPVSPRAFELSVTSGFDRYSVEHGAWTLSSMFQPVFSLSHMRAVGYEGLLRAHDALDRVVSPLDVFGQAALCRRGDAGRPVIAGAASRISMCSARKTNGCFSTFIRPR